jgi:polyether ionophore transport system permease protein
MKAELKLYNSPKTVIARFVARRTVKSASLWALVFGVYMAQKTLGFAKIAPTQAAREKLASSFSNNAGITALLGTPRHVDTLAGYANWNSLGVITIVVSIWSFLLATKYLRGEEENGRSEVLLSGQVTTRGATLNTLAGMMISLVIMFIITALTFVFIGRMPQLQFSTSGSIFFALASVSGAAVFFSVGALASQLMPTRSMASSLAALVFGVFFLLRAVADITSLHWLLNLTPIGWIEKLQPLVGSQPVWFAPIFLFSGALLAISIWMAGRRDLGASTFKDRNSAKPRYRMLGSPLPAAIRLTRASTLAWMAGLFFMAFFYGAVTKAAVQAIGQAASYEKSVNKLLKTPHVGVDVVYLSVVYLILMTLTMSYVASASGKIREDEADGFLDNFLVRPYSRLRWLGGRVGLAAVYACVAGIVGGIGVWAGQAIVHNGASFSSLLLAGINMIPTAIFILGCAVLALGFIPRLTTLVAYGVLGWSFILSLLSSGIKLNHWLLDTSILHQVTLAPASNPNWAVNLYMTGIGLALCVIGALRFNGRDLQSE